MSVFSINAWGCMLIEGVVSERDYVAAQFLHLRPRRIFSIIGVVLVTLFLAVTIAMPSIYSFGVLSYLLGYFFIFIPWWAKKTYRQYKAASEPFSIELREKGLYFVRENAQGLIPWNEILKWKCNKKLLLLYPASSLFCVLPLSIFKSQDDTVAFQDELKKRVGKPV